MLMHFQTPAIHFGVGDFIRALGLGTIAAVVAAFRPARNASKVPPVEAMAVRPPTMNEAAVQKVVNQMAIAGVATLAFLALSSYMGWNLKYEPVQFIHQVAGPPALILLTPIMTYLLALLFSAAAKTLRWDIVGRLAQDNLRREPGRAANNILTLGLGLYLVVVVSTINSSFKRSIGDWADRTLAADLVISSFGRLGSLQTQPIDESLKDKMMAVPEIANNLAGPIGGLRFIHTEYAGRTIAIKAFDDPPADQGASEAYRFDVIGADRLTVTRQVFDHSQKNIAISKNFATHFNLGPGQTLHLETPSGPADLKIVAVVNDFASHEGVLYFSRSLLKEYWHDNLLNAFYLSLKPGVDPVAVKSALDSSLGAASGLMVKFNSDLKAEVMSTIDQSFAYTHAIELAALLCGLLGMMNMMFISVLERTREIGLLRSVGMSKSQVFRTIFTESVSQGVIAGLIATSVGLFLAYLWVKFSLSNVIGWSVDFHVPGNIVLLSVALGVLVAGIAGLIPAYRAAGLEIKESLNYD
jgi:putative ABC transport system permease protein